MRRLSVVFLILSSSFFFFNCSGKDKSLLEENNRAEVRQTNQSQPKKIVVVDQAWVRSSPSNGEVITKLPVTTEVEIIEKGKKETINGTSDYWYKIKVDDKQGWIFGAQISLKENQKLASYELPKEVSIKVNMGKKICKGGNCLVEEFFPIGWSEDEQFFAWVFQPESEAVGGYNFHMKIQNITNDKIVWEWKFEEHKLKDWDENSTYNLSKVWSENINLFTQKLREYKVVARDHAIIGFPFKKGEKSYSVSTNKKMRSNSYFGHKEVEKESVTLTEKKLGNKLVFKKEYSEIGLNETKIIGLIPSPSVKRAVIIKVNEKCGWEGPPHILNPEIIGCYLEKGFEK